MKKEITSKLLLSLFGLASLFFAASCSDNNNNTDPTPANGVFTLLDEDKDGMINQNMTLDASKKYLIQGKVYVQSGSTLTIPAGTHLFGDKKTDGTLIVNRGAKIVAIGEPAKPIVFTSAGDDGFRNRGDWGGVVLLGYAYTNGSASSNIEGITGSAGSENGVYGPGTAAAKDNDNSGTLQYVRVEFAGIALSQDNELNSLTMGSVGSGSTIDHIQVSYANDDAYEWFGGSVNHKYLVTYSTLDDDFDTDRGYNGNVQFGLVVRDPMVADFSGSRAWESSSNGTADVSALPAHGITARHSAPTFSNVTVLGPRLFRAASAINGFYQAALEINQSSGIKIYNSILTGFPTGVRWNVSGESAVKSNVFSANAALTATSGGSTVPATFTTDNAEAEVTTVLGPFTATSLYTFAAPYPVLQASSSPALTGAMNLTTVNSFFENVAYKGAFGTTASANWNLTAGWLQWDPINATYFGE